MLLAFIQFFNKLETKRTFEDVFGPSYTPINYAGQNITQTLNISQQNVYIYNCYFHHCLSSTDGGAIYCSGNVYRMLIERSSFLNCMTAGDQGGAIYSGCGNFVLSRICSFNCVSTLSGGSYGQFAYLSASVRFHINESSITHVLLENTRRREALCIEYRNILLRSDNLTNINCYEKTVIFCGSAFTISYSSIVNNSATGGYGCIYTEESGPSLIDTCNILNNKLNSPSTSYYLGAISTDGNLLIKDSCIIGNYEGKIVFHAKYSHSITISNCTIDDDIFTGRRYSGTVTVSKTIKKSFTNSLSHFLTRGCDVTPKTPARTTGIHKKSINHHLFLA